MQQNAMTQGFGAVETDYLHWRDKNLYYNSEIERFHRFLIPAGSRVAQVGMRSGHLLNSVEPSYALAIDSDGTKLTQIQDRFKNFKTAQCQIDDVNEMAPLKDHEFDYVIAHGVLSKTRDIQPLLRSLKSLCTSGTKLVVSVYNSFWEPLLKLGSRLGMRSENKNHNWLSQSDLQNLFFLEDLDVVSHHQKLLLPKNIPILSWLCNNVLVHLPIIRSMALMQYYVLRVREAEISRLSSSIVIPARNESGNIENAVRRLPQFGGHQEIIFVEGHSTDDTWDEILRVQKAYPNLDIKCMKQTGKGKGDAVRCGFNLAKGDVLFILDADLTVPPEDLPRFYDALSSGKGEFINGTRLVYPMEKHAMRFLNLLGNKFFAWAFSAILGQKFKDTLCGTKVLRKKHYNQIAKNRSFFGEFDPFGDFDLLFGAAKLNLKIVEIPIRYRERTYGTTNISRFRHGWLLLKMCVYAARKFKFS